MKILITGGAGFIGSTLIRFVISQTPHQVVNLDKLTYAGNLASLRDIAENQNYRFVQGDINDSNLLDNLFKEEQPDAVMHLAAESHVDRSIDAAEAFVQSNVVGTYKLLESAWRYWKSLSATRREAFRFHHISTDEVFGDLYGKEGCFTETTSYAPSSPYSASKAASDHFVRAWHRTYGLPTIITICSNNYGPYQFPEKLIPLVILNALEGQQIPIYGTGDQVRDWLYVEDHARALYCVLTRGSVGETYNIGGKNERRNIEVVSTICKILDDMCPNRLNNLASYADLITFVEDRPGHDKRYSIDASYLNKAMAWEPKETFESGIRKTINWYLENTWWWQPLREKTYATQRLGLMSDLVITERLEEAK